MNKNVRVRIFTPGNKRSWAKLISAPPRRVFKDEGIDEILQKVASDLEKRYPDEEFRLVPLGPREFNFVHVGERCRQTAPTASAD